MADGQPLPPFVEDGVVWHVVQRSNGRTTWRRISLTSSLISSSGIGAAGDEHIKRAVKEKIMGIDLREYSGSRFIKLADVEMPIRATIVAVEKGKWEKLDLLLSTGDKFSLNKQNTRVLSRAYGTNADDLIGQEIELFKGELDFQNEKQPGVVVRPISLPSEKSSNDEVPFDPPPFNDAVPSFDPPSDPPAKKKK
jgi:hypothetical protein